MGKQSRRKRERKFGSPLDEILKLNSKIVGERLAATWPEIDRKAAKGKEAKAEIGRELRIDELMPRQIVAINIEGYPTFFMTVWVDHIDAETVTFRAADVDWTIMNFRTPEGTLVDDKGKTIHVHEWKPAEKHRRN